MEATASIDRLLETLRAAKPELVARFQVEELALFGSLIRGEGGPNSDLDVLVSFREAPSLLRFVQLENELTDRLGVKVDLVMRDALKPGIGRRILQEIIRV